MRRVPTLASGLVIAMAVLVPGSLGPAAPPVAGAAVGAPEPIGRSVGKIECYRFQYETRSGAKRLAPSMPCDLGWDTPVTDPRSWTFDDDAAYTGRAGNGLTFSQTVEQSARYEATLDRDGNLVTLDLSAELRTTVDHAGYTTVSLDLDIPFVTAASALRLDDTIQLDVGGGGNFRARGDVSVRVDCGGDDGPSAGNRFSAVRQRDGRSGETGTPELISNLETGDGSCVLRLDAQVDARNSEIIKSDHRANAAALIRVKVDVPPCDLGGVVRDGVPSSAEPYNRMTGIPVELLDGSGVSVAREVTDRSGAYCFRDLEGEPATIRATLEDGHHDPPIFRTIHVPSTDDVITEKPVMAADLGRQDFDLDFAGIDSFPLRHEVAAVHREGTRFVDWLLASGVITVAQIATFEINTDTVEGTSYLDRDRMVRITRSDTRFSQRNGPRSECPENCEWHEIAHHVGFRLGVPDETQPNCAGRVNHGGWRNGSTCDSIIEGFPTFLALIGSMAIDADRSGGYGTPDYGHAWNLEDNGYSPWDLYDAGDRGSLGREDFAVAQLLTDLTDATPGEAEPIVVANAAGIRLVRLPDAIDIDPSSLVGVLAAARPSTLVALRAAILASDLVGDPETAPTIDLDGDEAPDVSALDAVFLIHGFHPVPDLEAPFYGLGDSIGDTRRQSVIPTTGRPLNANSPVVPRSHMEATPGASLRLENPTGSAVRFHVVVAYPVTTSEWDVEVGGGESALIGLELPVHSRARTADGSVPPCGGEHDRVVTVTITAPGTAPLSFENCAWNLAIAEADGEVAMTYSAAGAGGSAGPAASGGASAAPGQGPDPVPAADGSLVLPIIGVGALAAIVGIGVAWWVGRRRNRSTAA